MKRTQLNFVIDATAFAAFFFLLSTGALLRYQLPPGSGGLHGRGAGQGEAQQQVLLLWGRTRHEWGDIHYWIACLLMAVLALHLFLHWEWVFCVVRGRSTDASGLRLGLGLVGLCAVVLLAWVPWMSPTEQRTRGEIQENNGSSRDALQDGEMLADEIRGSMSLQQIADRSGHSVSYVVDRLGLPKDVSPTAQVGPLLRTHGLRMSDLRQVIGETPAENARGNRREQEGGTL